MSIFHHSLPLLCIASVRRQAEPLMSIVSEWAANAHKSVGVCMHACMHVIVSVSLEVIFVKMRHKCTYSSYTS